MIIGEDLMNLDFILSLQGSVSNQPEERKNTIRNLRKKIHKELKKFKIETGGKKNG